MDRQATICADGAQPPNRRRGRMGYAADDLFVEVSPA